MKIQIFIFIIGIAILDQTTAASEGTTEPRRLAKFVERSLSKKSWPEILDQNKLYLTKSDLEFLNSRPGGKSSGPVRATGDSLFLGMGETQVEVRFGAAPGLLFINGEKWQYTPMVPAKDHLHTIEAILRRKRTGSEHADHWLSFTFPLAFADNASQSYYIFAAGVYTFDLLCSENLFRGSKACEFLGGLHLFPMLPTPRIVIGKKEGELDGWVQIDPLECPTDGSPSLRMHMYNLKEKKFQTLNVEKKVKAFGPFHLRSTSPGVKVQMAT